MPAGSQHRPSPDSGRATIAGYDVATQPELVRANIGFMSGNTGIYDRMTAYEFVKYYGELCGVPDDLLNSRMEDLFATLRMNDFRDVLGSKMSTGMKQKVSIARTLIHDPPVLIFDEPTSGLDVLVARTVLDTVDSPRDKGKCIIFSTHIMREVENSATGWPSSTRGGSWRWGRCRNSSSGTGSAISKRCSSG